MRVPLANEVHWVASQRGYSLIATSPRTYTLGRKGKALLRHATLSQIAEWLALRIPDEDWRKQGPHAHPRHLRVPNLRRYG